jgi:hypothetical protein
MDGDVGCGIVVIVAAVLIIGGFQQGCGSKAKPEVAVAAVSAPVKSVTVASTESKDLPSTTPVEQVVKAGLPDFTIGTFPFWILVAVLVVGLIVGEATESGWVGLLSMSIFLGMVQWLGQSDPLGYAQTHPKEAVLWLVGYFVAIGLPFAVLKWMAETFKVKQERKEAQQSWLSTRGVTGYRIPLSLKDEWVRHSVMSSVPKQPLLRQNKARFIRWIYAWPGSLIWTLCADIFRNIGTFLYYFAADKTQRLSDLVWGDVDKYVDDVSKSRDEV